MVESCDMDGSEGSKSEIREGSSQNSRIASKRECFDQGLYENESIVGESVVGGRF